VWNYAEADEAALLVGHWYANIHTTTFPGGELRGQIVALNALLNGAQENPPTASAGFGWAVATVDTATNQISYYVYHSGLSGAPTAGHLHGNALHGTNAGVKLALASLTSPISGSGAYAEADEAALLMGRWYVNLHTAAFPGGEIRGQLVPRVIPMDALQETPVNAALSSAGIGLVALDTLNNALSHDVRVIALSASETAAHIHGFADLGSNAGVQTALPAGAQKLGVWTYGAANEADVIAGRAYFNVHTTTNPGGEIRGQILDLPGQPPATLGVGAGPAGGLTGLAAAPNPSAGGTRLTFQLARTGSVSLAIVGLDGRIVRELPASLYAPGTHSYDWDGLDARGARVAPGMYFAIVRTPEGTSVTRLARLR